MHKNCNHFNNTDLTALGLLLVLVVTGCSNNSATQPQQLTQASKQPSSQTLAEQEPLDVPMATDELPDIPNSDPKSPVVAVVEGGSSDPTPEPEMLPEDTTTVVADKPLVQPVAEENADKQVESGQLAAVTEKKPDSKPKPAESVDEQLARMRAKLLGLPETSDEPGPPREIKLLIPDNNFDLDAKHKALRVTFDDIDLLKVLNMEPVPKDADQHMPKWLSDLNGKRIILRGWMYPAGRSDGIERFMFVRDSGLCCFGSNPKIYDKLAVTMRDGMTTKYIQGRAFDVVATLRIEADILDDELFFLYHLDDALVIDE